MKIRNGFVSNSSSSSFVLLGLAFNRSEIDKDQLIKLVISPEKLDEYTLKYYKKKFDDCDDDEKSDALYDAKNESTVKVLLHEEEGAPSDKYVIGLEIAEGSDYDFPSVVMELSEALVPLTEIMMNFKDKKPMIITGTKMT